MTISKSSGMWRVTQAKNAGYSALVLTIDTPVAGLRYRDKRNGSVEAISGGIFQQLKFAPQMMRHLSWLTSYFHDGGLMDFPNIELPGGEPMPYADIGNQLQQSAVTWKDLDWIRELNLEYDLSTFDTDPFEANSQGVETIFPFWVEGKNGHSGYIEMPYTLAQDFTPYILMREKTIDIWKRKVDWVAEKGGMVLVNVHPDYLAFDGNKPGLEEFPVEMYEELLDYIKTKYSGEYWHVLPRDLARFWRENMVEAGQQAVR